MKTKNIKYRIKRNWNTKNRRPSKKLRKLQIGTALFIFCLITNGMAYLEYQKLASDPWVWVRGFPSGWDDRQEPEKVDDTLSTGTDEDDTLVTETIGSIEEKLQKAFKDDWRTMYAIMMAESGGRSDAIGDGHLTYQYKGETMGMSCGIFQIRTLPGRPSCQEMLDPDKNIAFAKILFEKSGFQPWSAYKNQSYLTYMK